MLKLFLILPNIHFWRVGEYSPIRTRGLLRGVVWELVRAMRLSEGVSWGISLVRSKSESIHPAFDNVPGKCAELERAVKLVNYPEGACPSES